MLCVDCNAYVLRKLVNFFCNCSVRLLIIVIVVIARGNNDNKKKYWAFNGFPCTRWRKSMRNNEKSTYMKRTENKDKSNNVFFNITTFCIV